MAFSVSLERMSYLREIARSWINGDARCATRGLIFAVTALCASGCTGNFVETTRRMPRTDGGPVVMLDLGRVESGPAPDAGAGTDAGTRVDLGPTDPCATLTCGTGARCDAATRTCVCSPGFIDTGGACTAAPPGDPSARTPAEMCARWTADRVDRATSAWTPGTSMCDPGTMPMDAIDDTLRRVNVYRWLSGLDPVTEDPSLRSAEQQCAHMMTVNGTLSHTPPSSWTCYTAAGAGGAGSSNLSLGVGSSAQGIDLFMDDSGVPSLGHRRWILNGPLGAVGIGFSGSASCLAVFNMSGASSRQWTAYPNEGVAPVENARAAWSFHSNVLSVGTATISVMRVADSIALDVTVEYPANGYGPNTVSFRPSGWTPAAGERYRVTVGGTSGGDVTYEVELISC